MHFLLKYKLQIKRFFFVIWNKHFSYHILWKYMSLNFEALVIKNKLTETILCCCWELIVLAGVRVGWLVINLTVCWLEVVLKMFPITCVF